MSDSRGGSLLHLDTQRRKSSASSPFGPVSQGLIPMPVQETAKADPLAQLSELLNSLESTVEALNYKSYTVYDTLTIAIEAARVALSQHTEDVGTDIV